MGEYTASPKLMQITRAPARAEYTIARATSSSSALPVASNARTVMSLQFGAIPAMPIALFICAPMMPATLVPCPCSSMTIGSGILSSPIFVND